MIDQIRHVNVVDYCVIAGYLLMLTGTGLYVTKFNRNADDFFKGGGKIPWWISGLSTFVAGFSNACVLSARRRYENNQDHSVCRAF